MIFLSLHVKIKPSSFGLLAMFALYAGFLYSSIYIVVVFSSIYIV